MKRKKTNLYKNYKEIEKIVNGFVNGFGNPGGAQIKPTYSGGAEVKPIYSDGVDEIPFDKESLKKFRTIFLKADINKLFEKDEIFK